jgi:hypothetical protein
MAFSGMVGDGKSLEFVRFRNTFGHFAVPSNARTPEWLRQLEGTINSEDFLELAFGDAPSFERR